MKDVVKIIIVFCVCFAVTASVWFICNAWVKVSQAEASKTPVTSTESKHVFQFGGTK